MDTLANGERRPVPSGGVSDMGSGERARDDASALIMHAIRSKSVSFCADGAVPLDCCAADDAVAGPRRLRITRLPGARDLDFTTTEAVRAALHRHNFAISGTDHIQYPPLTSFNTTQSSKAYPPSAAMQSRAAVVLSRKQLPPAACTSGFILLK